MQTKHKELKSSETNHKIMKNAMKKWSENCQFTNGHHILRAGIYLGQNWSDISLDIGSIMSYICSIVCAGT
jgi:hypothetical protein